MSALRKSYAACRPTPFDLKTLFFKGSIKRKPGILVKKETAFQTVLIIDTFSFGRCLIIDDELQSAEYDEYLYHESLVHPVFYEMSDIKDKNVLILGGGEGATVREVLKHKDVKRCTMVDIDKDVIQICASYLPSWKKETLNDKRSNLIIADAQKFLLSTSETYDLIIADLPSPAPFNSIRNLYEIGFMINICNHLQHDGWFVTQAGPVHPFIHYPYVKIKDNISAVFSSIKSHQVFVPSFGVPWGFLRGKK